MAESLKWALCFFLSALFVFGAAFAFGMCYGREIAAAKCYRIKAERCLNEPIETVCECLEEGRKARIKQ